MNQHKERVYLAGFHEVIKERFYAAGEAVMRPVQVALTQVYPLEVRARPESRLYKKDLADAYEEKRKLAITFLYEQRNLVNNKWLPRYEIGIAAPGSEPTDAHAELVSLLIDGCLERLFENLGTYAPMILPADKATEVFASLRLSLEVESKRLREFLSKYRVQYRKGVAPVANYLH